jgi:hypothetical protein
VSSKNGPFKSQQWCVGRSQESSPLPLVQRHIRHYWPLSRNSGGLKILSRLVRG